jgi:VWFA-related protein
MLSSCSRALALFGVCCAAIVPVLAQAPADNNPPLGEPLQLNVRNVLVDVVVTDKNGSAVPGLHKEDFVVLENGKPQTIEYFEPHFPAASAASQPAPTLPPNTFTNIPAAEPNQAINILLMDALNTSMTDQMYVRKQMVKYLASIPPGLRVGVFTLSDRLRIVQGFTDDSALLRSSVNRLAGKPTEAAMEATPNELATQSTAIAGLNTMASGNGGAQLAAMISNLQNFLATSTSAQQNQQLLITLDALQSIAHYVSSVPGRKNLIWFVGSFPLCLPDSDLDKRCPYEENIETTINALAAARVSVYPIDASGVVAPNGDISGAGRDASGSLVPGATMPGGVSAPNTLYFQFIASENWAKATGGRATHNNDIKGELAEDLKDGSSYYTVAYTPTDPKEIGRERKITVKLKEENYKLAYRRTYFERTPAEIKAASTQPDKDPLRPLMDRGMPNFADLHFKVHVEPDDAQFAGAPPNGDNPAFKPPFKRYTVRFFLSPKNLNLVQGPDGVRRAPVEVALIAYSQRGESLNWLVRSVNLAIRPDQMEFAETSGIPFHFDFDLPPGDVYLRAGIYDSSTNRAGTLEIPEATIQSIPPAPMGGH